MSTERQKPDRGRGLGTCLCGERSEKSGAYREQHAVNQKQRLIRICPPGTFRSRSTKRKSRISPISGPAGCPPARPDCPNCRHPTNLTNHRVRTSQSSSLSDGSCSIPAVCDTRGDRLNWVVSRPSLAPGWTARLRRFETFLLSLRNWKAPPHFEHALESEGRSLNVPALWQLAQADQGTPSYINFTKCELCHTSRPIPHLIFQPA